MADLTKKLMLAAYDERVATQDEPLFLLNLFPNEDRFYGTTVDVDVIRSNRKVAADVVRGSGAAGEHQGERSTAKEFKIPLYHEKAPITEEQLVKRVPGVDPYTPYARQQALAYHSLSAIREMRGFIRREMNRMAGEALEDGEITLSNTESLDFHRSADTTVTPGTKWDTDNGTPFADIESLANTVYQKGKVRPGRLVFGSESWSAFVGNKEVKDYLDNRRISAGQIAPEQRIDGAVLWGRVAIGDYEFDLHIYSDFYETDAGVATPYFTADSVLMLPMQPSFNKVYGAVEVPDEFRDSFLSELGAVSGDMIAGDMVPYLYTSGERMSRVVGVQSAPLVIPTAIDTIGTFKNVDS